jgi:isopenicillin-N N-acyltransferase-like protein
MPVPIQLVRVSGTHFEAGRQAGEACAETLRGEVEAALAGTNRDSQLAEAFTYYTGTRDVLPWVVEELDGIAAGARLDPVELFCAYIEEIAPEEAPTPKGKCSDLVAGPSTTSDGHMLVAHNNDLYAQDTPKITAVEWSIPGDPTVLTIGVGPMPSVGWNSAGISFTGNELTPNDNRIGIPRLVQFRAMLREPTLEGALAMALHSSRASSYNHVMASRDGRAVNVEGSATDAEVTEPDDAGYLAHTNHYACDAMLPYEGDEEYAQHSAVRLRRANEMLHAAAAGTVDAAAMRAMLSDHENKPDCICRHPEFGSEVATVFWCVADVTDMRITFGRGNPCDSIEQEYRF